MGLYANPSGSIRIQRNGKYSYYVADVYHMRKRYKKTFPYTELGRKEAEIYLKRLKDEHADNLFNLIQNTDSCTHTAL